jgi:hypothetical protein
MKETATVTTPDVVAKVGVVFDPEVLVNVGYKVTDLEGAIIRIKYVNNLPFTFRTRYNAPRGSEITFACPRFILIHSLRANTAIGVPRTAFQRWQPDRACVVSMVVSPM